MCAYESPKQRSVLLSTLYIHKDYSFLVEKTAEPAFVVVVETYPSFAVALRQIAVVVAAAAVTVAVVLAL